MSQSSTPATCANCGAPDGGDFVICRYCRQAVSAEAQAHAIPCPNPQCRALCRWGKQNCKACNAWLVVSCVFCGALSPHHVGSCLSCREAFAGAPQRKQAMLAQRQQQQDMQNVQVWGNLALGALGVAAAASAASSWDAGDAVASTADDFDFGGGSDFDDSGDFGGGDFGGGDFG